jgi:hypothetical protein
MNISHFLPTPCFFHRVDIKTYFLYTVVSTFSLEQVLRPHDKINSCYTLGLYLRTHFELSSQHKSCSPHLFTPEPVSVDLLKVPKREIFVTKLIILSHPIWIGDLRNKAKNRFVRIVRLLFVILVFFRWLSVR